TLSPTRKRTRPGRAPPKGSRSTRRAISTARKSVPRRSRSTSRNPQRSASGDPERSVKAIRHGARRLQPSEAFTGSPFGIVNLQFGIRARAFQIPVQIQLDRLLDALHRLVQSRSLGVTPG